ncbi:MAG TPA: poly-gamma-glutamate hydrolase family protein [Ilumatobacteraceae bacterium]|nr:poly-gamma-glutamate hydrolase family protein [Ilumatobacteraceae bacterium]
MADIGFDELLALPGVEEHCELRSAFGFMAYHGGALEEATDVVARAAAEQAGASYYGVHQPDGMRHHIPSTKIRPQASEPLARFIGHVDVVVTIHGYGRRGYFTALLLGGRNRRLADHVAGHLRPRLPAYDIITDVERIPPDLRGMHAANPVNLPRSGGVQIELPPRARGSSPLWWDWEGGLVPHTEALIAGLADAAITWSSTSSASPSGSPAGPGGSGPNTR